MFKLFSGDCVITKLCDSFDEAKKLHGIMQSNGNWPKGQPVIVCPDGSKYSYQSYDHSWIKFQ